MQLSWVITPAQQSATSSSATNTGTSGGTASSAAGFRDFAIDLVTGDLSLSAAGDLVPVGGISALCQSVKIALQLVLAEWFNDPSAGVDWFGSILGQKGVSTALLRQLFTDAITSVQGITGVPVMNVTLTGRQLSVSFQATSDLGLLNGTGTGSA